MFTKSYDVGNTTPVVLDLRREMAGVPSGPHGKREVVLTANENNISVALDEFVRKAKKDLVPASTVVGTGVDDIMASVRFATAVGFEIHEGSMVTLYDTAGSAVVGQALVANIAVDRRLITLTKMGEFTYPTANYAIRLYPSALLASGDKLKIDVAKTPVISLLSANAAGSQNVSIIALGETELV